MAEVRIPLHVLAGFAQYEKPKLRRLVRSVREAVEGNGELSIPAHELNEEFLLHKVRGLAERQFDEFRAPVELCSNAIEAAATRKGGQVRVTISRDGIVIEDNGRGMDLDEILTALSVPYQQAEAKSLIGRFGIGFLSNLGLMARKYAESMEVETRKEDGMGYRTVYRLEKLGQRSEGQAAASPEASSYFVYVREAPEASRGTKITIRPQDRFSRRDATEFLSAIRYYFSEFDGNSVSLTVNGKAIKRKPPAKTALEEEIETTAGKVGLYADYSSRDKALYLTQGGVIISRTPFAHGKIVIGLPHSIPTGESRRGFQLGPAYFEAMHASFKRLSEYVSRQWQRHPGVMARRKLGSFEYSLVSDSSEQQERDSPLAGFCLRATPEEMREHLTRHAHPLARPEEGKQLVHGTDYLAGLMRGFAGAEIHVVRPFLHPVASTLLQNKHIPSQIQFLRKLFAAGRSTTLGKMSQEEKEHFGLTDAPDPQLPVHIVRLSERNTEPFLYYHNGTLYGSEAEQAPHGLYINENHPAFTRSTPVHRELLRFAVAHAFRSHFGR